MSFLSFTKPLKRASKGLIRLQRCWYKLRRNRSGRWGVWRFVGSAPTRKEAIEMRDGWIREWLKSRGLKP